MKRKILSLICLFVLVVGCTSSKESEKVCSLTHGANKESTEEITVLYKGDTVSSITSKTIINMEEADVELTVEELEKLSKDNEKIYDGIDGVKWTYGKKEKNYIETMTVDITDDNIDELKNKGIINMYLDKDNKLLKAEAMIELLEASRMKCN